MSDQPFDAAVTAYGEFRYFYRQRTKPWDDLSDYEQEGWRQFIAAALPELTAAAAAQAAAAERESIRQLAIERKAVYVVWHKDIKRYRQYPFAGLLGGTADGAHPDGGAT